jgi:hypothetical protein
MYPTMSTEVPWSLVKSGFKKSPHFNTQTQKPAAGRGRTSISFMPYATWDFELDINYVLGGEAVQWSVLQRFLGCYMACCGAGGFFWFTDPNDNAIEDQSTMLNVTPGANAPMGQKGDGASTQFQLARLIDQGVDVIQNAVNPVLFVNGSAVTGTVGPTGVVVFDSAPPVNAVLTWQGSFLYLCQFNEDTLKDLARVSKNSGGFLWSCSSIAFESVFV